MDRIIGVAIIVCMISVVLKQYSKELLLPVQLCFAATALIFIADYSSEHIKAFRSIAESYSGADYVITALIKGAFICIATDLAADICKESGNIIVRSIVVLSGRIMLFILSLPYIRQIIKITSGFLD